jgi:hypothetical protein
MGDAKCGGVSTGTFELDSYGCSRRVLLARWECSTSSRQKGIAERPWEDLKGQIYSGSDEFVERHSAEVKELKEIPRAQLKAIKPPLQRIFAKDREPGLPILTESMGIGCRDRRALEGPLRAVSRKLKKIERTNWYW